MKRLLMTSLLMVLIYVGFIQVQVFILKQKTSPEGDTAAGEGAKHRVYSFSFSKYSSEGKKEIEIEGDSADILSKTVNLMNVVAKAYAEEVPVTITADRGNYDKEENQVYLRKNVVATTEDGTRLLTEELDIHPADKTMETSAKAKVKKDNIQVDGLGASGDSQMKRVRFKQNVRVMIQGDGQQGDLEGPTVITCDGPLVVDYAKNIAHFEKNVIAQDSRGRLMADTMDVYYNKMTRQVSKMVAMGNVVIENNDGNKTFSDNVIYLADEGRIILGGDTEAVYYGGDMARMPREVL